MVHLTIAEEGKKRGNFIVSAASHTNAARQERMCVCVCVCTALVVQSTFDIRYMW